MRLGIFDTHAHYDDERFEGDRDRILRSGMLCSNYEAEVGGRIATAGTKGSTADDSPDMSAADTDKTADTVSNSLSNQSDEIYIRYMTDIGCNMKSSYDVDRLTREYDNLYGAVGVIPHCVEGLTEDDMKTLAELVHENNRIVAIGEIGLDYHYDDGPDRELQQRWFGRQMELARELSLPIVIHSRDAAEDTLRLMREHDAASIGGVMHCYSYSKEVAEQLLRMDFYFGIGGVVTFKNAKKLIRALEAIPLERIVLETDCPYLAPEPYRGRRNDSRALIYVAEKLAELKGVSVREVIEITYDNACRLYRLQH